MGSDEFRRISTLFKKYLAKDLEGSEMRIELGGASEKTLGELSCVFSCRDLGNFFRWEAVLGEFYEKRELKRYVRAEDAVSFYLACFLEGASLDHLGGLARKLYEEGKGRVTEYNELAGKENMGFLGVEGVEREYYWLKEPYA